MARPRDRLKAALLERANASMVFELRWALRVHYLSQFKEIEQAIGRFMLEQDPGLRRAEAFAIQADITRLNAAGELARMVGEAWQKDWTPWAPPKALADQLEEAIRDG